MAKAIVEKAEYEALNPVLKAEYREGTKEEGTEGKFVLKVDAVDGFDLQNVAALKNAHTRTKEELKTAKATIKGLGDDFDLDTHKENMAELEKFRTSKGDDKIQARIDSEKKTLTTKHAAELKAKEELIAARDREVADLLITAEATRAIVAAGGSTTLLLDIVTKRSKVERPEKGKPFVQILGDDGNPMLTMKSGADGYMGIEEYVGILKKNASYAPAFQGSGASGSQGGQRGGKSGGGANGHQSQQQNNGNGQGQNGQPVDFVQRLKDARRAEAGATS